MNDRFVRNTPMRVDKIQSTVIDGIKPNTRHLAAFNNVEERNECLNCTKTTCTNCIGYKGRKRRKNNESM